MKDINDKPADPTLQYYQQNAEAFMTGTVSADMLETRERFLKKLPEKALILDFGCGSGRDTKAFLERGYAVDAVDGSTELCRLASEWTGICVRPMLFQELSAIDRYDGIWACASILHLPEDELRDVLRKTAAALKKGGILYTSFKYGTFRGVRSGRWFTDFTEESLAEFLRQIPSLEVTQTWLTHDVRPGREEERWINILARRV